MDLEVSRTGTKMERPGKKKMCRRRSVCVSAFSVVVVGLQSTKPVIVINPHQVQAELKKFLEGTAATPGDPKSATIVTVSKCDGTASVACVRAKLRFFFELAVDAKFSVGLADGSSATGTLAYPSMTAIDMDDPDERFELKIKFDASTPNSSRKEAKELLKGLQVHFIGAVFGCLCVLVAYADGNWLRGCVCRMLWKCESRNLQRFFCPSFD